MRTSLLLALATAFAAVPASAQASFGLKAGLNTTFASGDGADGSKARLGFVGGAVVRYDVTPTVGLQVEGLYSQKGFNEVDGFVDEDIRLDYVEIPVLLRLGVPLSPLMDAGVTVGPSIGIPIRGKDQFDDGLENELDLQTDLGVAVGLDVGSGPFFVDARYTAGLRDVLDEADPIVDDLPGNGQFRNQAVTFTFGYRFGGGSYGY